MKKKLVLLAIAAIGLVAVGLNFAVDQPVNKTKAGASMNQPGAGKAVATFAGGCFWCTEADFEKVPGVIEAISGYSGGNVVNPTYDQVSSGGTGHTEAVQVYFDPKKVSYEELLEEFWRHMDPTDPNGQFVDRGKQYRPAIFYHNEEQMRLAMASRDRLAASGRFDKPLATEITEFKNFYVAEDYHQNYYKNNPLRYNYYRSGSGRDQFLEKIWGNEKSAEKQSMKSSDFQKPADSELRQKLTPLQYRVTQQEGTEPPFQNEYWQTKNEGIYVDIVSGEPLFSSTDKYDSGTGWPSFSKPLVSENVIEKEDRSLFMARIEVRSKQGDSHLGHVFADGPQPTGLRYCINSASLRFIPKESLEQNGYSNFAKLFAKK